MLISVAQWSPLPEPEANAELIGGFAARAAVDGARLLLAPEGCSTNFIDDPTATIREARPVDGPFGAAVLAASQRHGIAIAAGTFTPAKRADGAESSVPAAPGGRVHNTVLIADRGELRRELPQDPPVRAFSFTESETVVPGDDPAPVLDFDGVRIGFATCYDLRFRGLPRPGGPAPTCWRCRRRGSPGRSRRSTSSPCCGPGRSRTPATPSLPTRPVGTPSVGRVASIRWDFRCWIWAPPSPDTG